MMRACLILAAALCCFHLAAFAQIPTGPDKKSETGKGKDADPGKSKSKTKADDTSKDPPRPNLTLDKLKTPGGAVIVIVEELREAMGLLPKLIVLSPEEYQAMQEQIRALKRQLKVEEALPHSCKLQGKLEGDFLALRAEYAFATDQPRTTVFLGLLGAHLMDDGELDGGSPVLDATKEGYVVRVDKAGDHLLTLNLRVRVDVKRSTASAVERGIELGLPGAAVTMLQLEMPFSVKELRWNENLEKTKTPGRWLLGLEKSKSVSLSWKEPVALAGNAPLAKVESQISVRIDETHVNVKADLFLEDLRFQTKEWQLLLPPQAKVEATSPTGQMHPLIAPDGVNPCHVLKVPEATAERWQVTATLRIPRPNPGAKLAIGPFTVLGAFQQYGTISVQMPAEVSLGQRLVFHRQPETYQLKNTELESTFQFIAPATAGKNPKNAGAFKAPLELEWRYDKNQMETRIEHDLKCKTVPRGVEVEVVSRIKIKAVSAGINTVDLKLPMPRQRGVLLYGTATPMIGFPASLPWSGLWNPGSLPWSDTDEYSIHDDLGNALKLTPQDAFGKTRVAWGSPMKNLTLVIKAIHHVPAPNHRVRLELPRALNTQDRAARVSIQTDERMELLFGPIGAEEPVPDRHHFDMNWDQAPSTVDLAWRPHQREVVAEATIDLLLHEHTAQVRQAMRFPLDSSTSMGADPRQLQVRLDVPRPIEKVTILSGEKITNEDIARQTIWLRPKSGVVDKMDLVLQYDLVMERKLTNTGTAAPQTLQVPLVWPAHVSRKEVKIRVWTDRGGVRVRLNDALLTRGIWKERGIEMVPDKNQFPALVLQGAGSQLPLAIVTEDAPSSSLAALLADRGLIQVTMNDDGSQLCRARFLIRRINAAHMDVELPFPVSRFQDRPTFFLGKHPLRDWHPLDPAERTIRVPLHPEHSVLPAVLEIQYTIPAADAHERNRSWRTTLEAPVFRSEAVIRHLRWQLSLPTSMIAVTFARQARVDTQWSLQGWLLTPEPSVDGAFLEQWLTGREPTSIQPVTFAFSHSSLQPITIYHLPRAGWLLGGSGLLLVLALGVYCSPMPRLVFPLFLLALAVVVLSVGIIWPATLPPLLFACQPGVVLLALFVAGHWYWQERYRRQLVFLPAFSRTKPSSTMTRANSAHRPRDASTVDAPTPPEAGAAPSASGSQAGT